MAKLSKFVVSRLARRQEQATDHPDADTLLAFTEGDLSPRERTVMLGHLARCPECREVVALTSAAEKGELHGAPSALETRRGVAWWKWRWATAVAVACLAAVMVWRPSFVRENQERPPATAAKITAAPGVLPPPEPETTRDVKAEAPKAAELMARKPPQRFVKRKAEPETESKALRKPVPAPPSVPHAALPLREQPQGFVAGAVSRSRLQRAGAAGVSEGSLWKLAESVRGTLQRSEDGGKTWQSVRVDEHSRFYALSVIGAEVWVGGAEAALFHSADNGSHWMPVVVADEEQRLHDAITRIDVRDEKVVRLKTQAGGYWVTADGGLHWRLE